MSLTNTHDPALERGRLCVVIATIVINVIAVSLLTFAPWSDWRTGAALNFVDNSQALAVKGISPNSAKLFQKHLALFQQQKPIRL